MRPTTVSITGIASPDADGVCVSQTVPGASALVLDGALTTGYSATSLSAAASGVTAATLTAAAGNISPARQVVLVSAGNDSGKTVTVVGLGPDGVTAQSETVTGANTSRTATTKIFSKVTSVTVSSASAGNFSVGTNGIRATLSEPRRVVCAGGTTRTYTVTGTDVNGNTISETTPTGTSTHTVLSFKTITSIVTSGSTATCTVGEAADSITGGAAHSRWIRLDEWAPGPTAIQVNVSGTANYTIQQTLDDPTSPTYTLADESVTWVSHPDSSLVAATASAQGNYAYPPMWARVLLTSGSGSVTARFSQSNVVAV